MQHPVQPVHDWAPGEFTKFSNPSGEQCVEIAKRPGFVAVRNSNHPFGTGPIVEFTEDEWSAFRPHVIRGDV